MPPRPPKDYTTKIAAKVTAAACQDLLIDFGADKITLLAEGRRPAGLTFELDTEYGRRAYRLPVQAAGVHALLAAVNTAGAWPNIGHMSRAEQARLTSEAHALDVAWRNVWWWLQAQLALIASRQATASQAMIGYMLVDPETTVIQRYESEQRALMSGS